MMDWSDRHCRYFWRLLSRHARLYTEMVTTGAILHGDRERFLQFNAQEHPIALQVGGSDPKQLADCARFAEDWGYDEINLNCGCPSDRVQNGKIGACLMAEPELVAECVAAMQASVKIPVTVKHRIGIDDQDSEEDLRRFVSVLYEAGCRVFIVHARKAWLKGLSPKENREVPPLDYDRVLRLKSEHPDCTLVLNGGITRLDESKTLLNELDGVMVGREIYHNPYWLAEVDREVFGETEPPKDRDDILSEMIEYCQAQMQNRPGTRINHISRHLLGLYMGQPGARRFRRYISENATRENADFRVLIEAQNAMNNIKVPTND